MKNKIKLISSIAAVATPLLLISHTGHADDHAGDAACSYSNNLPIIPDGNIATKDELVAAKNRIGVFQVQLADFRDCIADKVEALDKDAEDYEETKKAFFARSDASVNLEEKVAAEFNTAIRIYKER